MDKVYVITEDWAANLDSSESPNLVGAYLNREDAVKDFLQMLQVEETEGIIQVWKDREEFLEEKQDDSYECWLDGCYCENHYCVRIWELTVNPKK